MALLISTLTIPEGQQWEVLRDLVRSLFRCEPSWAKPPTTHKSKSAHQRQKGYTPVMASIVVNLQQLTFTTSVAQFWDLHNAFRQSSASERALTAGLGILKETIRYSRAQFQCYADVFPAEICSVSSELRRLACNIVRLLPAPPIQSGLLRGRWSHPTEQYSTSRPVLNFVWLRCTDLFEKLSFPWEYRLNALAKTRKALLHANAMISTLGGGYFM